MGVEDLGRTESFDLMLFYNLQFRFDVFWLCDFDHCFA
jgi:hypothetical protein